MHLKHWKVCIINSQKETKESWKTWWINFKDWTKYTIKMYYNNYRNLLLSGANLPINANYSNKSFLSIAYVIEFMIYSIS